MNGNRLYNLLFLLLIIVVYSFPLPTISSAADKKQIFTKPVVHVAKPKYDFGAVNQGEKVEHNFEVFNKGDAELKIEKIQPSCGCTAAVLENELVAPGKKTTIRASFDTTGFHGEKVKTIRFFTNDPETPSTVLSLEGRILSEVKVDPPTITFEKVRKGEQPTRSAVVTVRKGSKVKLSAPDSVSEHVEVSSTDVTVAGRAGKKLSVKLKDTLGLGVFQTRIVLKTTSKKNPVINVPVYAFIEGALQLSPHSVSFGLLKGPITEPKSASVTLENKGSEFVKVLSVSSSSSSMKASFSELVAGKSYAIKVTLEKGASGVLREEVEIVTDHPNTEQQKISLPIYAIITKAGS